jgi:hypothetical protein
VAECWISGGAKTDLGRVTPRLFACDTSTFSPQNKARKSGKESPLNHLIILEWFCLRTCTRIILQARHFLLKPSGSAHFSQPDLLHPTTTCIFNLQLHPPQHHTITFISSSVINRDGSYQ